MLDPSNTFPSCNRPVYSISSRSPFLAPLQLSHAELFVLAKTFSTWPSSLRYDTHTYISTKNHTVGVQNCQLGVRRAVIAQARNSRAWRWSPGRNCLSCYVICRRPHMAVDCRVSTSHVALVLSYYIYVLILILQKIISIMASRGIPLKCIPPPRGLVPHAKPYSS